MVDDLFQAAMFKQNMLPRPKLIRRLAKLVGDIKQRRLRPAVINTCIAIPCYSKLQIKGTIAMHRKPKIRRHHYVAGCGVHPHLNRPAIER